MYPSLLWNYLFHGKGALSSSTCDIGYFGATNASYTGRPDLQMHGMLTAGDMPFYRRFLHYDDRFIGQESSVTHTRHSIVQRPI